MGAELTGADPALRANIIIPNFIKGAVDTLSTRRIMWGTLKAEDRIVYDEGGDGFHWQFEKRRASTETNDGTQTVTPTIVDRFGKANLDFPGFVIHDRMTKRERLKLKPTKSQLINYWAGVEKRLVRDIDQQTNSQFYIDGVANPGNLHGFRTFTAYTQTITQGTAGATARTANVLDPVAYPDDSYAGNDTDLGAQGGSAPTVTNWPFELGTEEYYSWTPVIIRALSSYFGATTWAANCQKAIRLGLMFNKQVCAYGADGYADWVIMNMSMMYDLANLMDGKERVLVSNVMRNPYYGWQEKQEAINIDGAYCTWEVDTPTNQAFGLNFRHVTLRSMQPAPLFHMDPDSPKWNGETRSWTWIADFLAQFQFDSPRNFFLVDANYSN